MEFEGSISTEEEANKIMHIALPIDKHDILMGSDSHLALGVHNENETRSKIFISAESKEEADKYIIDFQQVDKSKCQFKPVLGVHTFECLETNLE